DPGRLSTTIVSPCARPIWSANKRATMSAVPAGGEGTTDFIGLGGWGQAVGTHSAMSMTITARGMFFSTLRRTSLLLLLADDCRSEAKGIYRVPMYQR